MVVVCVVISAPEQRWLVCTLSVIKSPKELGPFPALRAVVGSIEMQIPRT